MGFSSFKIHATYMVTYKSEKMDNHVTCDVMSLISGWIHKSGALCAKCYQQITNGEMICPLDKH